MPVALNAGYLNQKCPISVDFSWQLLLSLSVWSGCVTARSQTIFRCIGVVLTEAEVDSGQQKRAKVNRRRFRLMSVVESHYTNTPGPLRRRGADGHARVRRNFGFRGRMYDSGSYHRSPAQDRLDAARQPRAGSEQAETLTAGRVLGGYVH